MKTLTLVKPPHTHLVRYEPGDELAVAKVLIAKARDPCSDFDWFDAAIMSHQMGRPFTEMVLKKIHAAGAETGEKL